jgi:hypothetical protein
MLKLHEVRSIYKRYGFDEVNTNDKCVIAFTLKAGHYHNADIIPLAEGANTEVVFQDFKRAGYACKIRNYKDASEVCNILFRGFFSVDSTRARLLKEYDRFTQSIVSVHSDDAIYSYVNSSYVINGELGDKSVILEILERFDCEKPTLFLIEAAAGFGKTCTAYELLKEIIMLDNAKVPLFSELSRNRQAKIFRYVLLDEIDRSFPLLSSSLVRAEIKRGNVPVILDGFDELLHQNDDGAYEKAEPMLETIGELLTDKAKVVLTTRRTAILDGDDFHEWINRHEDDFDVVRIKINTPSVSDWLPEERMQALQDNNFQVEKLCNPVLLSYLRCISDVKFKTNILNPDSIVDEYFKSMLERERTRQDLLMTPDEQYDVLLSIAEDMMLYNYTGESKDYILSIIQDHNKDGKLDRIRKLYPVDSRPTTEELLNKLANHALLDRSNEDSQSIGFVNEFVLGNLCAGLILSEPSYEWTGDKRFIEPVVLAYQPRSDIRKYSLWLAMKFSLEFCNGSEKLINTIRLTNSLLVDLVSESIDDICVKDVFLFEFNKIVDTVFNNSVFSNVIFDEGNMRNVTFVGCEFFSCTLLNHDENNSIYALGCSSNNDFQSYFAKSQLTINDCDLNDFKFSECDKYILEKFWPKGSQTFHKHRPAKGLYIKNNLFGYEEIIVSIEKLKKLKFFFDAGKNGLFEFNIEKVAEVKSVLGK